jgi:hypothetical protein
MERARIIISDGEAFFELQNIKMLRLLGDELDGPSSLLLEPALHGFRTQAAWFYGVGG